MSLWVVIALAWLLTLPALGVFSGDHGTYVSVAQRLIAGDRLYADVWDNKDPFFFYALAMARAITPLGDLLLEIVWLVVAAASTAAIARAVGLSTWRVGVAAWVLTPFALIGATYVSGMTHLPGSAVSLAALACAFHRRWLATGALVGALVLLKLPLLPVAVVMVGVVGVTGRQWSELKHAGYASLAALGVAGSVMAIRGELVGYLGAQWANVSYSGSGLVDTAGGSVLGHLLRVVPQGGRSGLVTLVAIVGILLLRTARPFWKGPISPRGVLWWCTLLGMVCAVGVLGLTAMWTHHAQILYLPGVLSMVLLVKALPYKPGPWYRTPGIGLLLVAAFLVGGAEHPLTRLESADLSRVSVAAVAGPSEEALAVTSVAPSGRYARLGTNDVSMHAKGLEDWTLACRRFHQYPFDPQGSFGEIIECLPTADVVIVSTSFSTLSELEWKASGSGIPLAFRDEWNTFVAEARAVINAGYTCETRLFGEVCRRTSGG